MGHAWACGSVAVPSESFLSIIENTDKNPAGEHELLEEDSAGAQKKGRSRTPSKREKSLIRALRKL
jgi:hypothetical protein